MLQGFLSHFFMKLYDSCCFGICVTLLVIFDLFHIKLINKSGLVFPLILVLVLIFLNFESCSDFVLDLAFREL